VVPQVSIYAGESFDEVAESMFSGPVTFIGLDAPGDLPAGSQAYPLDRLGPLIPA
jgi:hypothetical protein